MTNRRKLLLAAISTAVVSMGGYLVFASLQSQRQADTARSEIRNLVEASTLDTSAAVMRLIATQDETLRKHVDGQLNVVHDVLRRAGKISFAKDQLTWNATNQYSLIPIAVTIPKMEVAGRWIGKNFNARVPSPIVDEAQRLVGGTMTIFQRINERGDMLRVATNVRQTNGERAIGTYIPAVNPNGEANRVISTVLRGDTFRGAAWVVNAYYVADYEPLRDDAGKVVGMLYAGERQDSGTNLRAAISRATVGKTGGFIVVALTGEKTGRCLISRDERNARDIATATDVNGVPYGTQILDAARGLESWESKVIHYTLGTRERPIPIVARVTKYTPWGWAVVTEARESDFADVYKRLENNGGATVVAFFLLCGALVMISLPLVWAEATERRSRAAEQASHAKSEFLSRMSHELRTPMNAILGFAQILELDDLTDDQADSVSHIRRAGQHLLQLINEVLDISRIEAGAASISLEPVSVSEVAHEVRLLLKPIADQRRITVDVRLGESDPAYVTADRQRLLQVVLNLASNAVKFNRDDGNVLLTCSSLSDGKVRISVVDTGKGIAPERTPQLFVPFERLGAEHSQVEGTGLGLALSKRLVEAMGGTIGFTTSEAGTTFFVDLDSAERPSDALPDVAEAMLGNHLSDAHHRKVILLIEDNMSNVHLIEKVLGPRSNVKLLVAMQGTMGYELAVEHEPHVILMDLNLPDIHGFELLARVRATPSLDTTKVIVVSADATESQISRLLHAGAHSYLTKPLDLARFFAVLDEVLSAESRAA